MLWPSATLISAVLICDLHRWGRRAQQPASSTSYCQFLGTLVTSTQSLSGVGFWPLRCRVSGNGTLVGNTAMNWEWFEQADKNQLAAWRCTEQCVARTLKKRRKTEKKTVVHSWLQWWTFRDMCMLNKRRWYIEKCVKDTPHRCLHNSQHALIRHEVVRPPSCNIIGAITCVCIGQLLLIRVVIWLEP